MSSLFALFVVLGFMGNPATPAQQMARHSSAIQHTVFIPSQTAEVASSCIHVVQRGETLAGIAPTNWRAIAASNGISNPDRIFVGQQINLCGSVPSTASTPTTSCSYVVKAGDTLAAITANWRAIAAANGISNPNVIFVGEQINLCASGSGGASNGAGTAPTVAAVIPASSATKGANTYPWGWCTWGAAELAHDNVNNLGDASSWFVNARARGLPTGYAAQAGATAVFQAGYHVSNWGTSAGHVAHVDAVSGNMMEITEMNNQYWGGFGRWDTIWIAIAPGVSFIY